MRWVVEAFLIFRAGPIRQLLFNLAFLAAVMILVSLPVVGFALVWLMFPALSIGPHAIARAAANGAPLGPEQLLSGFRENLPAQLRVGGVFLAAMLIVLAVTAFADDGRFAQAVMGRVPLDLVELQQPELQRAMLIGAGLQTALLGALWYAPLLVAWEGLTVTKAAFFSTAAALINWRAFLAYGVALTLLFSFVLLLALSGAMLLGGSGAAQANSALFSVIWTLLPVWFASSYLSYRDVFNSGNAAKSPTIPA